MCVSPVPSEPEDIKATSVSQDTILLSWKQPVRRNGEVRRYTVLYCTVLYCTVLYCTVLQVLSYTLYKRYQRSVSTLTVPGTERQFTFKGIYPT